MIAERFITQRLLHDAAQPLDPAQAVLVQASLEQDPFDGNFFQRITNSYSGCQTRAAIAGKTAGRALVLIGAVHLVIAAAMPGEKTPRWLTGAAPVRHGRSGAR